MTVKIDSLPLADARSTASIQDWLVRFAACVRAVDYAAARPFWHPDIIVFGTYQELIHGMATVVAPWTSTGFHPDGTRFDRPGRATITLARQQDGRWLGIHSHMSLQRGVPQDSHGNRPVKAR